MTAEPVAAEPSDEAYRRADAARRWVRALVVYWMVVILAFLDLGLAISYPALGVVLVYLGPVLWVLCLVASVRALSHGYTQGHREGRIAAYVGLFLTTFFGLFVAYAMRPEADD